MSMITVYTYQPVGAVFDYFELLPHTFVDLDFDELAITVGKAKARREMTEKYLDLCGKLGIFCTSVNKRSQSLPKSITWPFGPDGSVFANNVEDSNRPAIWNVVQTIGICTGAGNGNQHQIKDKLFTGIYHLVDGEWFYVSEETYGTIG